MRKMKINFKEYEEMVERFNLYVFRWVYVFLPIVVWLISFLVVYFDEGEVVINFIVCTIMAVVFQKISKILNFLYLDDLFTRLFPLLGVKLKVAALY